MWVFLSGSFLSIVQPPGQTTRLMVRGRAKGDIERVFPGAEVTETPFRDYRFRATLPVGEVAEAMMKAVLAIDYGNFKDSVGENDRHTAYFKVWSAMNGFQYDRNPRPTFEVDRTIPWYRREEPDTQDDELETEGMLRGWAEA
jgi:hypothetical protein